MKKTILIISLLFVILITGFLTFYSLWNSGNPERTCASCHEINPSLEMWQQSSHREIACAECHGSALSNGMHSLMEKSSMVFTHLKETRYNTEIRLTEEQVLSTMQRCSACHQEEYRKWASGGHSATYAHIFLNEQHNKLEQPYWDCLRCHGMYYEGTVHDLIAYDSSRTTWEITDHERSDSPSIPCLSCHKIHSENRPHLSITGTHDPAKAFYLKKQDGINNPKAGLYIRADKIFLRADKLPAAEISGEEGKITLSSNPIQNLCVQCHAPNYKHQAGSEDDKTPTGVHEGLSCTVCHEVHSNDALHSCTQCHPAVSNCGLDVMTMNTSYLNEESKNDIHHLACTNCHPSGIPNK